MNIYQKLCLTAMVIWFIWSVSLIIRDWMGLCRKGVRMKEVFLYIIYTLAVIVAMVLVY